MVAAGGKMQIYLNNYALGGSFKRAPLKSTQLLSSSSACMKFKHVARRTGEIYTHKAMAA